ncbi:MAG TPA: PH domain-containing protein [Actinomycetospora sp.]|nr:PH domain-containing protein [Actinomycetospora sp.]
MSALHEPSAWAAPWPAVVAGAVAALGLGAWAVAADDAPGRVLTGAAAIALAVAAVIGAVARPRLRADETGLVLRGATGTRRWPWERVDAVRTMRMRRMGLPASYLEVEARDEAERDGPEPDSRLLVLGRLELGADPVEVADALQAHRARAGRARGSERQGADGDEHDEQDGDPGDGEEPGRRP